MHPRTLKTDSMNEARSMHIEEGADQLIDVNHATLPEGLRYMQQIDQVLRCAVKIHDEDRVRSPHKSRNTQERLALLKNLTSKLVGPAEGP